MTFSLLYALIAGTALYPVFLGAQKPDLPGKVVDIRAGEYFIISPDSIRAGLITIRLTQTGDVTKPWPADMDKLRADLTYHFHMVWLVRLDSGKTAADLLRAEHDRAPTPWATILGGPGFADTPGSSNVTMIVPPGNYAFVCYVGSAREDRDRYHLLKGMIRPLRVTGKSTSEPLPVPRLRVSVRNDSTVMSDTLVAGSQTILVRNTGKRPTDFAINRLKPGYTVAQARAWRPRMMTEPPKHAVGGVVWIASDSELLTTVVLEAGDYFFGNKHVVVRK
ncbi:MAG TPA: hypothetical protein VM939_08630 [Gemmatimonadaceae bacterium]|nr:hypothetical protein [Gemmatimonadaceae bacterium]